MGAYLYTCTKCGQTFPDNKPGYIEHSRQCRGRVAGVIPKAKPVKLIEKSEAPRMQPKKQTTGKATEPTKTLTPEIKVIPDGVKAEKPVQRNKPKPRKTTSRRRKATPKPK